MSVKNKLSKITSKYILKDVFSLMHKKTLLNLIKYNKNIQDDLNISIDNYKKYRLIEIEIELEQDKYGKFINLPKKEKDKAYFHIYVNGEERFGQKRNYINKNEKVTYFKVVIDYEIKNLNHLFNNCVFVKAINFKHFERNNITKMSHMFYKCSSLTKLNTVFY